jgi:hypothetical protein
MKILYLIQTFKEPEQIYRLVQIIKKSSPASQILVSHDFSACDFNVTQLQSIPGVEVLRLSGKGGRGDFSMIQGYLDAVDWLFSHNTDFDWLINLSGQDYPTQPLPRIEKFLAETKYDGFLEYFKALSDSEQNPWGISEGHNRYLYQYWRSSVYVPMHSLGGKILNRLGLVIEKTQPFIRLFWTFDCLTVGVIATSAPFNENFLCYGGSYYHALSRKCVQFLYDFSKQHPDLVDYYRKTICPNESFIQTVLLNSGLFNLCNDCKRYLDFTSPQDNSRPRTLTFEDYPALIKDNIHFARKFEPAEDSRILDMLDARILQNIY